MEVRTLCDIPRQLLSEYRSSRQLLYKDEGVWRAIPTQDLCERIRHLALGLKRLGVAPGDRVALLSENRPEWTATDYAILSAGAATVPIYPTLPADQVEFILANSEAVAVVVSSRDQLAKIQQIRGRLGALRTVVAFDPGAPLPENVIAWEDLAGLGREESAIDPEAYERSVAAVTLDDLASIIYTSGTTGVPKGVMLTHGNFLHNVKACCAAIPFVSSDLCLSFLPLSHIYERTVEYCYLYRGATIAYAESIEAVPQNLKEVRPTIACGVPRLFEKMHRRILDTGAALGAPGRPIFFWALATARRHAHLTLTGKRPTALLRAGFRIADRLIYSRLRARLGGRLRFFISGGAPLSPEIAEFFHGLGILILQGYGLTETSPVIAVNRPESVCFESVGRPVEGVEVRIAEDGEILTRGPSVMKGYFRDEEATREALLEGWFRTGDVGRLDQHGCLVITDRKKEILKTSGGKMVAPQPIENLLKTDRFIGQAVLVGDRRHFIAALIVPNFDQVRSYAALKKITYADPGALLRHPRVRDLFERRIARVNERLARHEQIKRFVILERELTVEAGEVTPTLKYRRKAIEERYRPLIEEMYAESAPGQSPAAGAAAGG
ncbi:MAG TPA: long-chain fatty acid--CoA ligase [Candidatus Polarisedimenticolia bacterium]|nr:long-chain fatty acid--CoA ligase [Candidatus Polarisedimenticolia bacterium]